MNLIDTHTHLYVDQFDDDRLETVQAAIELGVSKMLLPNIDLDSIDSLHDLAQKFPRNCFPMMGLHPCSVKANWEGELNSIKTCLFKGGYCGVGEIGIDLYRDSSTLVYQKKAFTQQIEWAKELGLPIVIHVREAFEEAFEVLDLLNDSGLSGVFHCFTGSLEQAHHILAYGQFKLGIGGVLTFKNSGLDKVIEQIDMEHLILETDSPYLAPAPYRGKRNETAYIIHIASKLAEIKGLGVEEVAEITTENAMELFKLASSQ